MIELQLEGVQEYFVYMLVYKGCVCCRRLKSPISLSLLSYVSPLSHGSLPLCFSLPQISPNQLKPTRNSFQSFISTRIVVRISLV